jgi:hypothetical protein
LCEKKERKDIIRGRRERKKRELDKNKENESRQRKEMSRRGR